MGMENSERRTAWNITTAKLFVGNLQIHRRDWKKGKDFSLPVYTRKHKGREELREEQGADLPALLLEQ